MNLLVPEKEAIKMLQKIVQRLFEIFMIVV